MRVALALLVDDDLANRMAQVTMRLRDYGFGLRVLRLPAHVSLKQPFVVEDFTRFEQYFDSLATQIEPQQLHFNGFQFWGHGEEGVISLRVIASERLRALHAQINAELEREFGDTRADYDGDAYEFHLTVGLGRFRSDLLPLLQEDIAGMTFDAQTLASNLAMFVYEESNHPDALYGVREYGTYKLLPLA